MNHNMQVLACLSDHLETLIDMRVTAEHSHNQPIDFARYYGYVAGFCDAYGFSTDDKEAIDATVQKVVDLIQKDED